MRVITPFGFGKVHERDWKSQQGRGAVPVELDQPFLGDMQQVLEKQIQVFPFTDWAVVRVLNVSSRGWFSNLQFHEHLVDARMRLLLLTPPDETVFLIDLHSGEVELNQELGVLAQDFVVMRPWLDRWAEERTETFEDRDEAAAAYDADIEGMAGSTGIATTILLNGGRRRLLRFSLVVGPPQGVVFNKKYA